MGVLVLTLQRLILCGKRPNTVRLVPPRGCNGAQQCYERNENVKRKQAQNEHA